MGEIKSTLDLVMEKTRHLTSSVEEKKAQKQGEIEKRIKGLVLKYQENLVKKQHLSDALADLRAAHGHTADQVFKQELLKQIDPDGDNAKRIALLKDLSGVDVDGLEALLHDYNDLMVASAEKSAGQITEKLSEQHRISGSAVMPNLEKDAAWLESAGKIRDRFEEMLREEKENLMGA
jgi:hypothetical protein